VQLPIVKNVAPKRIAQDDCEAPVTYAVMQIPVGRIRAFAFQPRKWFDPEEIRARAASMRAIGQQDPVTVEPVHGDADYDFELINGESRLRSAREAGLSTLWAAVRSRPFPSRIEKHLAALVANFNRSDHTPMEISDALHVQATEGGRSQEQIACAIGKPPLWVSKYLSLQRLHPEIQALLHPTVPKDRRLLPATGFELAKIPLDRQLEVMRTARGADGRVTLLRVKIEAERTPGKKTRKLSPSKRREAIENTVRAIRLDLSKLQSFVGADAGDIARLLRGNGVLEEGIDALQSVRAHIRRQEQGGGAPRMLDVERMTEDERAIYNEEWRNYWLGVPRAGLPMVRGREMLLLEVAYPHAYKSGPHG